MLLDNPYQHLAYLTIWLATPNGGVHSLEGAPPGWLTHLSEFAHPFNWAASYALKDQNQAFIGKTEAPSATVSISGLVDDNIAIDDATHANDVLHVFFRRDNTQNINHLTTPMNNVTNQKFAGSWSPGCDVEALSFTTGGQVAAIDTAGLITIVYPDANGKIMQSIISPRQGMSGPQAIFGGVAGTYKMATNGTPALASIGSKLILCYRATTPSSLLYYTTGVPAASADASDPPYYVWTSHPMQITWAVGGLPIGVSDDPGLIVVGDYVYVSVGGQGDGGPFPIRIYRCPVAGLFAQPWELYLNGIKDSNGNTINTKSFARLFSYGDGYAVVAKDPNNNALFTALPLLTYAPQQSWSKRIVSVPSPQSTVPPTVLTQTIRSTLTAVFYGGNVYMFFADQGTTDLSMVTSKPPVNILK